MADNTSSADVDAFMTASDKAEMRTAMDLGDAATKAVGTTAGSVAAGDDSRFSNARTPTAHAASHTDGTDDIRDATATQKGLATATQIAKLDDIEDGADVTSATNVGSSIGGASAQTTLLDTDLLALVTASSVLKKLAYSDLKTLLNALYQAKSSVLATYAGINPSANVQSVLGAADYATMRDLLSLGSLALQDTVDLSTDVTGALALTSLSGATATDGDVMGFSSPDWIPISPTTLNVGSATKLATARTINGVAFDGTANVADYAADAGSTDAYAITLSPAPGAYITGAHYRFMANTANTGAATLNVNSLGAKTIVKAAGGITTALADNDIRAGQWVDVVYDGTNMQMQSTLGNAPSGGSGGDAFFFIGAAEMIPCVSNGPGINSSETSTNKVNYDSLDFDPGTVQYAQATRAWPTGWNTATAKFLWTADSGSGDVVFGAQARCIVNDDPIDSAFGTAQTCTDTLTAAGDDDVSPATSAFTPAGTVADGAFTRFQFYRDASSGSDTLSTNARLLGVLISKAS